MRILQLVSVLWLVGGYTPHLRRQDICGIWKLSRPKWNFPSRDCGTESSNMQEEEEVVLRLNDDGSFDPYTPVSAEHASLDDLHGILGRGGSWEYRDDSLILAAERPESVDPGQVRDTVLAGKLNVQVSASLTLDDPSATMAEDSQSPDKEKEDIDVHLSIPEGQVSIGKFMYPKKHKAFFEEPILFKRSDVGTFHMNQLLGNLNARLKKERDAPKKPDPKFSRVDFYNRTFYLTTAPHPVNPTFAELDVHYDESKATMDVRVMPVTFHPNNTFTAVGTEKILRGRFEIAGDEGDHFRFRVSLFGFGRSAPGSVYSEGRLLSQDDRRLYLGAIQSYEKHNKTALFVVGEFYYETNVNIPRRSNSMGTFTLQEIDEQEGDDDDQDDGDVLSFGGEMDDSPWDDIEDAFQ